MINVDVLCQPLLSRTRVRLLTISNIVSFSTTIVTPSLISRILIPNGSQILFFSPPCQGPVQGWWTPVTIATSSSSPSIIFPNWTYVLGFNTIHSSLHLKLCSFSNRLFRSPYQTSQYLCFCVCRVTWAKAFACPSTVVLYPKSAGINCQVFQFFLSTPIQTLHWISSITSHLHHYDYFHGLQASSPVKHFVKCNDTSWNSKSNDIKTIFHRIGWRFKILLLKIKSLSHSIMIKL